MEVSGGRTQTEAARRNEANICIVFASLCEDDYLLEGGSTRQALRGRACKARVAGLIYRANVITPNMTQSMLA